MMKQPPDRAPKVLSQSAQFAAGSEPELSRETVEARSKIYELIVQFRNSAANTDEPRARALFEFSAEMLAGMARAFRTMEDELGQ